MPLPGEQRQRGGNRDQGNRDAVGRGLGLPAREQLLSRPQGDAAGGNGDQHDLDDRRQRFGLAVPEAVLLVRRLRGDPHTDEGGEAGDEVERGIGEAAEHRGGAGAPDRPALERREEQRHPDRGQRRATREKGVVAAHTGSQP